jgi:hypothetical protein
MDKKVKYIPLGLLFALNIKNLIIGFNWESVAISLILSGLYAFLENKAENDKFNLLKSQLDKLEKDHQEREKIISDINTSISSLRMSTGLKPASFRGV